MALQTSYLSRGGDRTLGDASRVRHAASTSWLVLTGVDVLAPRPVNAVVAVGDSITDGVGSAPDADERWTDALSRRLAAAGGTHDGRAQRRDLPQPAARRRRRRPAATPRWPGSPATSTARRRHRRRAAHRHQRHRRPAAPPPRSSAGLVRFAERARARRQAGVPHDDHAVRRRAARHRRGRRHPERGEHLGARAGPGARRRRRSTSPPPSPTRRAPAASPPPTTRATGCTSRRPATARWPPRWTGTCSPAARAWPGATVARRAVPQPRASPARAARRPLRRRPRPRRSRRGGGPVAVSSRSSRSITQSTASARARRRAPAAMRRSCSMRSAGSRSWKTWPSRSGRSARWRRSAGGRERGEVGVELAVLERRVHPAVFVDRGSPRGPGRGGASGSDRGRRHARATAGTPGHRRARATASGGSPRPDPAQPASAKPASVTAAATSSRPTSRSASTVTAPLSSSTSTALTPCDLADLLGHRHRAVLAGHPGDGELVRNGASTAMRGLLDVGRKWCRRRCGAAVGARRVLPVATVPGIGACRLGCVTVTGLRRCSPAKRGAWRKVGR